MNFEQINKKLLKYADDYAEKYPKYKVLELEYIKNFDDLLVKGQSTFPSQPLREAHARKEISQMDFYDEFTKLQVEINIIRTHISVLKQVSENLKTEGFREIRTGGGDYYGK